MAIDYTGNNIPTRSPSNTPADNAPGVLGNDVLRLAGILKEFLPVYKILSDAVAGKATSTDISNAISTLQTSVNTSLGNKVDKESGKTLYSDAMAANAVGTLIQNASIEDRKAANITGTFTSTKISDFNTAAQAAVPTSDFFFEGEHFVADPITSTTPLRIDTTKELVRVRAAITLNPSSVGATYNSTTGVLTVTGGGGGTSIPGLAAFTSPSSQPAGPVADTLYFKGASNAETDAFTIKPITGLGIQFTGGWIAFQSTFYNQGNGNIATDGNFYLKTNGNKDYFFTAGGLAINSGTNNDATSWIDINGTNGYNQLRLRTAYTPTSSTDTNGNVGNIAYDSNYIYVKTSTGWKRSAQLSTF